MAHRRHVAPRELELSDALLLSAVFAGLAWWFGWSAEGIAGPGGASWGDFGEWIRGGS